MQRNEVRIVWWEGSPDASVTALVYEGNELVTQIVDSPPEHMRLALAFTARRFWSYLFPRLFT